MPVPNDHKIQGGGVRLHPDQFPALSNSEPDPSRFGVVGANPNTGGALGFLGGSDLVSGQHAGVYGESDQQGVTGRGSTDAATGVFGSSAGGGCRDRGES